MTQQNQKRIAPLIISGTAILVLLLVTLAFFRYSTGSIHNQIKRAHELLESGDFIGARKRYQLVIDKHENSFAAHFGIGMSYCAETIYKTELALAKPEDWYPAIYHMTIAMNLEENDQVRNTLAILYFNLGTCYKKEGRIDDALKLIEQAVVYDPTLLKAHNLLGALFHERGLYQKAYQYYLKSIEIKPDYALAHFNLGALAWAQENYKQAASHFQRASLLAPENSYFNEWMQRALKILDNG